jgi:hypothetical protein
VAVGLAVGVGLREADGGVISVALGVDVGAAQPDASTAMPMTAADSSPGAEQRRAAWPVLVIKRCASYATTSADVVVRRAQLASGCRRSDDDHVTAYGVDGRFPARIDPHSVEVVELDEAPAPPQEPLRWLAGDDAAMPSARFVDRRDDPGSALTTAGIWFALEALSSDAG